MNLYKEWFPRPRTVKIVESKDASQMKKQMYNKRASILNTISAECRSVSPPEAENVSFYSFASNATAADHQPPLLYNFESTMASILYKF